MAWKKAKTEVGENGETLYWISDNVHLPNGNSLTPSTPHDEGEDGWEWTDEEEV